MIGSVCASKTFETSICLINRGSTNETAYNWQRLTARLGQGLFGSDVISFWRLHFTLEDVVMLD